VTATISSLQTLLLLVAALVVVALTAQRLRIAPPILMVVAGILLALIPGLPRFELSPEFVLLFVLPPVIYSSGVAMSWREFKFNLRPIGLLAIGGVLFTTFALAITLHYLLDFDWGVGFLLGAILSPPDAIAPLAIARGLGVPRRIVVVLEGEGLVNDATALVLYRFAVTAIAIGGFSLSAALGRFVMILGGEVLFGIAVGWISLRLRSWAHNARVEIVMSLMTPYIAFWPPAHLGGSGVLACVAAGLYVSWNGPLQISAATRLQGIFFWDLTVYVIDGLVFLYTGLQIRTLFERIHTQELHWMLLVTVVATLIAVIARFLWMWPATYIPRWVSKSLAARDPAPAWQAPFMIAFTGIRGVVSLAAALALPIVTANGTPFPHRDLFLFVAFGVIVTTLVGQGLTLPRLIRWLGLASGRADELAREVAEERAAREHMITRGTQRLEQLANERGLPQPVVQHVRSSIDHQRHGPADSAEELERIVAELQVEIMADQRQALHALLRDGKLTDESRRRLERELDLEEEALRHELDIAL
jgi:CPA1 family monovalent cation:H+ antiporter